MTPEEIMQIRNTGHCAREVINLVELAGAYSSQLKYRDGDNGVKTGMCVHTFIRTNLLVFTYIFQLLYVMLTFKSEGRGKWKLVENSE